MWKVLDHTADVSLAVEASSWRELLEEAAHAFGEWTSGGGLPAEAHETERAIEVRGADLVETWVHFWKALLRLWTVEGFLPAHARVEAEASATSVRARVGCVSAGALDPAHCADVKAVTWHGAQAGVGEDGRWRGRIVLDV